MRSSSVNFLSTVSDDDGYSDSASSSPLSSVSQNSVSHNAVSRVCRLTGRGLSKITFLGNAVLLSSVLSNIIESANAESNNGQNWEVLKSKLCALIFMESSIDKTFEASFHSVDARSEIRSILGEDKLSRNSTSDSELSTILMRVGNKYRSMISDFTGKVFEAEKAGLDVSRNSYRNVYWVNDAKVADTRICPYLHEFFDDMVPESTSISATTTTAATEMPVIATTGSTCMSNTSTALIFMLMMSLVALVFFLLGYKCSSSKKCNLGKYIRRGGFLGVFSRKYSTSRENLMLAERQEMVSLVCVGRRRASWNELSDGACDDADGLESVYLS